MSDREDRWHWVARAETKCLEREIFLLDVELQANARSQVKSKKGPERIMAALDGVFGQRAEGAILEPARLSGPIFE